MCIFLEKSPITRLFREQITHITITNRRTQASNESITDGCARIFDICKKLTFFDISQFTTDDARLLLDGQPSNTCFSSQLRSLFVNVRNFDDCLCLLDGRLPQLSSLTIDINYIKRSLRTTNDMVSTLNLPRSTYPTPDPIGSCKIR